MFRTAGEKAWLNWKKNPNFFPDFSPFMCAFKVRTNDDLDVDVTSWYHHIIKQP